MVRCVFAFELAMSNVGLLACSLAEVSSEQQWLETVSEMARVYARTITTLWPAQLRLQRAAHVVCSCRHLVLALNVSRLCYVQWSCSAVELRSSRVRTQCALALATNCMHLTSCIVASGAHMWGGSHRVGGTFHGRATKRADDMFQWHECELVLVVHVAPFQKNACPERTQNRKREKTASSDVAGGGSREGPFETGLAGAG
jgi:hypothetical protein